MDLLSPLDRQEVWAAGVTYKRSKDARRKNRRAAAQFYDLVYTAAAAGAVLQGDAHRVVGPGEPVRIRRDAKWNVPEPELTLVLIADAARSSATPSATT